MSQTPRFKVLIEGVQVPVSQIQRVQREGEPARAVISLWATAYGCRIKRGSYVVIFRWEDDRGILQREDPEFKKATVDGVWELFFDGYVERKPSVAKHESKSVILYCVSWVHRMSSVYIRSTSLSMEDLGSLRDKAFMGINLKARRMRDE